MRSVGFGRDNLRSHFVFRPRHAPEWLRTRFLPVVFLANEEELNRKMFTTSLNTTNPNTYVIFIFLRTSPLKGQCHDIQWFLRFFLREQKVAPARASVAKISLGSRANSFTAPAESRKCRFPRAIVIFCGLALWLPLFFPTQNGCQKSPIIVTLPL